MTFTRNSLVDWRDPELLQSLTNQPFHLARDIANVDISTLVQRVGEDIDAVALINKLGALRLANVRSENTSRPVAKRDKKSDRWREPSGVRHRLSC